MKSTAERRLSYKSHVACDINRGIKPVVLETKPLNQITHEAIQVLYQKIGIVNTVRFLNQFTTGYGDYTVKWDDLFAEITLDDILTAIKLERKRDGS